MFNELNNQMYQFFYSFLETYRQNPDSILGPELNQKLLGASACVCVFVVYIIGILILKFPLGFIFEYFWSKVLGGYVRDRGKKENGNVPYRPFNFLEIFQKFRSKG
jgi:hypothetical protein